MARAMSLTEKGNLTIDFLLLLEQAEPSALRGLARRAVFRTHLFQAVLDLLMDADGTIELEDGDAWFASRESIAVWRKRFIDKLDEITKHAFEDQRLLRERAEQWCRNSWSEKHKITKQRDELAWCLKKLVEKITPQAVRAAFPEHEILAGKIIAASGISEE